MRLFASTVFRQRHCHTFGPGTYVSIDSQSFTNGSFQSWDQIDNISHFSHGHCSAPTFVNAAGGSPMVSTTAACPTICPGTHLRLQCLSSAGKQYSSTETQDRPSTNLSIFAYTGGLAGSKCTESVVHASWGLFVSVGTMMPRSNAPCWLPTAQSCPPLLELPKYRTTIMRTPILCRQAIAMATYRLPIPLTQVLPSKSSSASSWFSSQFA